MYSSSYSRKESYIQHKRFDIKIRYKPHRIIFDYEVFSFLESSENLLTCVTELKHNIKVIKQSQL